MFETLRAKTIERLYQYMEKRNFIRGQKVYQEGLTGTDGLYFVLEGDFEVRQSINADRTRVEEKPAKRALSRSIGSNKTNDGFGIQSRS